MKQSSFSESRQKETPAADLLVDNLKQLLNTKYKIDCAVPGFSPLEPAYHMIMKEIILETRFGQRFTSLDPSFISELPFSIPLDITHINGREKVYILL